MCPSGRNLAAETAPVLEFRTAFDILDADRDGKISRDDLRTFYSGFSGGAADDEEMIGTMMSVADSNKDGFVQFEEFERVLIGAGGGTKRGGGGVIMEDVFKVMDKDGDGKLSHDDLKSYMKWAGFEATDEDINAMIRFRGGNNNNNNNNEDGVSFDDLIRILALDF